MPLWHNIGELMDYYIPPMPLLYWIDITRKCNLRCVMCPQSRGVRKRTEMMPMAMFRRIVDEVCENGPLVKLYLSGEPLLHDRLFDMIDYAAVKGCRTMLHTNATVLTEAVAKRILVSSLAFLSFSFDGCTREVYEKLRPPAKFERVRSNIRRYLELRGCNGNRGPHTTIEIIRMRETEPFIDRFIEEWSDGGVDDIHVADYMMWPHSVEDRRVGAPADGAGYNPCAAPFQHGCILADGTVVPCCMDVDGQMPLGHVNESPFRDIWFNNHYRQLRLQMLTGSVPAGSICDNCCNIFRTLT
ncbi:MAG: radical SAM protein [Phycisphaerales bacterium]|nr:MAG: radical SAM protein [Phycisphaerales bacterium]